MECTRLRRTAYRRGSELTQSARSCRWRALGVTVRSRRVTKLFVGIRARSAGTSARSEDAPAGIPELVGSGAGAGESSKSKS